MARPNSKYFASVITKLLAHKRKENIEIDQSFKTMLRSDILTKAADVLCEQQRLPETGGQSFFAQWKYLFAAVPTFALLMFVGSQFMNMPVVIPEGELPSTEQDTVAEPGNQEDVQPVVENDASVESDEQPETVESDAPAQRVKTFPGSLVLNQVTNTVDDVQILEPEPTVEDKVADQQPTTPSQPMSFQLLGLNVNVSSNDEVGGEVKVFDESQPEVRSLDAEPRVVQVEETQPTVQSVNEDTPPTVQTVQEPEQEVPNQLVQRVDASVPAVPTVTEPAMEIAPSVQRVDYAVPLSSVQEVRMEEKVIPKLAAGRAIEDVVVVEREPGIVTVNMTFVGGGQASGFYTFNERTQVWDHVQYVTNSYYDNGLSYTTNFTYVK